MEKKLQELVEATFKGLNEHLKNRDYNHVHILDTNIIHGFPQAIEILAHEYSHDEQKPNVIVVSDVLRRELNGLKKNDNIEVAIDARIALKGLQGYLSKYEPLTHESYNIGAKFPGGSLLVLLPYDKEVDIFPQLRDSFGGDDQILSCCLVLREEIIEDYKDRISIVSDDADMHTSCFQFNVPCSRFEEFYTDYDYDGIVLVDVRENTTLYEAAIAATTKDVEIEIAMIEDHIERELLPNQFVRFEGRGIDSKKPLRIMPNSKVASRRFTNLRKLFTDRLEAGIKPGYAPTWEQECVLELLYDPSIDYVTLSGPPGGGKTMLPIDVALTLLRKNDTPIDAVVIANPPINASQHGYLPGSKKEKLRVENQNIFDALYFALGRNNMARKSKQEVEIMADELLDKGELELETLTYIKGRTLQNRFMLFDEAEDYEPRQMRKLASRLGKGSKIVFSGDPYQVDAARCSKTRNGLVYFMSRFKGQPNYGHITIKGVERSVGAEQSAKLL